MRISKMAIAVIVCFVVAAVLIVIEKREDASIRAKLRTEQAQIISQKRVELKRSKPSDMLILDDGTLCYSPAGFVKDSVTCIKNQTKALWKLDISNERHLISFKRIVHESDPEHGQLAQEYLKKHILF
jgi:hypothetical protein